MIILVELSVVHIRDELLAGHFGALLSLAKHEGAFSTAIVSNHLHELVIQHLLEGEGVCR